MRRKRRKTDFRNVEAEEEVETETEVRGKDRGSEVVADVAVAVVADVAVARRINDARRFAFLPGSRTVWTTFPASFRACLSDRRGT